MKLIAFNKIYRVMLSTFVALSVNSAKHLGLSLRGAFVATKQSPTRLGIASSLLRLRQVRRLLKTLLAMTTMILLLATGCQASNSATSANGTSDVWAGFLEGTTIDVSSEVAGRIVNIAAQEGDVVKPGQPLVIIDDEFVRLRIDAADANVAAAQAQLALLQVGARLEDVQRAQARAEQARLAWVAASQAVTDTEAIRANPQTIVIAKTDAESRALAATQQLTATVKQAQAADLENQFWADQNQSMEQGNDIRLPNGSTLHFDTPSARLVYARDQWNQASNRAWVAWAAVDSAQANATLAANSFKDFSDQLANPIALDNRVNQARAARDKAAANLLSANAALTILREGASPAQIQTAQAALDQARAARATLDQEAARYQITAPSAGTVTRIAYRTGEIVAPGLSIVRLSVDGDLKLRVFVSFAQVGKLAVGNPATLFVGESNNRKLSGAITNIASTTEFAGRQAQTDNERNAQLVAVEIALKDANADSQIKAGMPANAVFGSVNPGIDFKLPTIFDQAQSLTFSGSLETKQTRVSAELGGRVVNVRVNRGDKVKSGDVLIELDDAAIKSALTEANATVNAAQSNLDQVNEKARPGTLALAEAGSAQAEADRQAANAALDSANRALKSSQDLLAQLHNGEGKVAAAQADLGRAQATLAGIKNQVQIAQNDQSMQGKTRLAILLKQQEASELGLLAAQTTLDGNKRVLDLFKQMLAHSLELIAAQHNATNQAQVAEQGIAVAQADAAIAKRGAQREAVMLAEAKLRAAQANQKIVQAQVKRFTLASPIAGQVVDRSIEPGETVRAGVPLITLDDPRELEMTLYVPIRNVAAIKPGQTVSLTVPSLPGKNYSAKVTFISPDAEFKPANIYNSKERSEMVFAIRVTVQNPNNELKAGLPADVTFQ